MCDRSARANPRRYVLRSRSHPLGPQLDARGVHDGRCDFGDAALLGVIRVDLLHHAAYEVRDASEALLGLNGPCQGSVMPRGVAAGLATLVKCIVPAGRDHRADGFGGKTVPAQPLETVRTMGEPARGDAF